MQTPPTARSVARQPQPTDDARSRTFADWAKGARWIGMATAVIAWTALALQYGLALQFRPHTPGLATLNFLSFFTNLSNLIVAFCLTRALPPPLARVAEAPSVRGAAALYILVTGVIYSVMLRGLWTPHGPWLAADILLHDVTPALYLIWWLTAPRARLSWASPLIWLSFPILYAGWTLGHGAMSGFYPYPFLNVRRLGLGPVLINMVAIGAAMLVLGYGLVLVDRMLPRLIRRAPATRGGA